MQISLVALIIRSHVQKLSGFRVEWDLNVRHICTVCL